jgi:acetyl/propionyl-CoA carboxylase alpha subunit
VLRDEAGAASVRLGGLDASLHYWTHADGRIQLLIDGRCYRLENMLLQAKRGVGADSSGFVRAPMHGKIIRLHVAPGALVRQGQALLVLEAMKMEHDVVAPTGGAIAAIHVAEGDQARADALLIEIDVNQARGGA